MSFRRASVEKAASNPVRISQVAFLVTAGAIPIAVLVQVSLIGLWLFSGQSTLWLHREFGHIITLLAVPLLVFAFAGRLPRRLKIVTALLLAVLVVQTEVFAFIPGSPARAFHTILPFVIFPLAGFLANRARRILTEQPGVSARPERTVEVARMEPLGPESREVR